MSLDRMTASQSRTRPSPSASPTQVATNCNQFMLLMSLNSGIFAAFTATFK